MNDICHCCRDVRELLVKKNVHEKNAHGRTAKVLTRSYSCGSCGSFMKGEQTSIK